MPQGAQLSDLTHRMTLDETHNFIYAGETYFLELWTVLNGPIGRWVYFYRIENGAKIQMGPGMMASNGSNAVNIAISQFLIELP